MSGQVQLGFSWCMVVVWVWSGSGYGLVRIGSEFGLGSCWGLIRVQLRLGQGQVQSDQGSVRVKSSFESGISFLERILTMPTP